MSFVPGAFDPAAYSTAFDVGYYDTTSNVMRGRAGGKPTMVSTTKASASLKAVPKGGPSFTGKTKL